nr:hypothetical protein [Pseudonocardia acaciae]
MPGVPGVPGVTAEPGAPGTCAEPTVPVAGEPGVPGVVPDVCVESVADVVPGAGAEADGGAGLVDGTASAAGDADSEAGVESFIPSGPAAGAACGSDSAFEPAVFCSGPNCPGADGRFGLELGPENAHTPSRTSPKTTATATARRRQYTAALGSIMPER